MRIKNDITLLIVRCSAAGLMFYLHGFKKILGYSQMVESFPDPLNVGIQYSLMLTIFAEAFCSLSIVAGFLTRICAIPLFFTMLVAVFVIHQDDPLPKLELGILYALNFLVLIAFGAGRVSLDHLLFGKRAKAPSSSP